MRFRKITQINYKSIVIIISVMMLFSCNVTKNIRKGDNLLAKNKIEINKNSKKKKDLGFDKYEIEQIISPKPNSTFLFFPVQLWIYQLYTDEQIKERDSIVLIKKGKDAKTKQHWSRRLGEAPVHFSLNDEFVNPRKIRTFLKNKAYYSPSVTIQKKEYYNYFQRIFVPAPSFICNSTAMNKINYFPGKTFLKILCNFSKESKTIVKYIIETGDAIKIDSINYNIKNKELEKLVINNKAKSILKTGKRLDVQKIENERKRISTYLRNSGYFTFSKDYIFFTIDTIGKKNLANVTINISYVLDNNEEIITKKHLIKDIYIYPNFKPTEALINKEAYFQKQDTLIYYTKKNKKYNVIYMDIPRINKKAIARGLDVASGDLYNLQKIKTSYKYLASLPIIQTANITFYTSKEDSLLTDSFKYIDCEIRLTQDKLHAYELRGEATYTSGNMGFASGINYTHNNFFRRTEVLDLKFDVEFKRITNNPYTKIELSDKLINSQKYSSAFNINFPRLFIPYFLRKKIKNSNPKSNLSGSFNFVNRPDYSWAIAGGAFGYDWNSTITIKHYLTPITIDYFNEIYNYIPVFIDNRNYDDRFIIGGFYKFLFNNKISRNQKKHFFITAYTKVAGNSLYGVNKFLKSESNEDGTYSVFGNTFAQFIKSHYDIRYYRKLNSKNDNIVLRLFTGIAFPYGNLNVIPFNEQFYSGGPNGLRAWDERTLGPGSYNEENIDALNLDIRADIKLEANFEYRKKLFNKLEGAFFIDAGNIWAINDEDKRDGVLFEFNDFYKEIAIGSGFGLRWDLTMIILRADIGMKVRDPAEPLGARWLLAEKLFSFKNMNVNFGIGYPF